MSDNFRPPSEIRIGRGRFPVRTLAILLMVAGAAGFVFSRLVYGDQVLCLLGSTLVTFVGLAIVFALRQKGAGFQEGERTGSAPPTQQSSETQRRAPFPGRVPPGLRSENQPPEARQEPVSPAGPAFPPIEPLPDRPTQAPETLLEEVIAVLVGQGAQVEIDSQRESADGSRGILRVLAQEGQLYSVLVNDAAGEVDVADVRGLYGLVNSSGSVGGFLVSSAPFTQPAYAWASAHQIRLVREDELREISL